MIINFITSNKGGGAELLVHELHKQFMTTKNQCFSYYFDGDPSILTSNEKIFNLNRKNPINIIYIRKYLKHHLQKTKKPLIIHAHLTWPFFYSTLASLGLKNINLIYTEHSTYNKRRKIFIFKYIDRFFYSRFKKIICISDGVHNSLSKWVGPELSKRLIVIKNGSRLFDLINRPHLEGRKPRIISIGSLTHKKNFITAIRAIDKIRDSIESYIIIGEGVERKILEDEIKKLKLQDKVFLPGWSNDIQTSLHYADLQLIPSLWEGFGLVAVEGMSTGLPIIASDIDGLREVLNEKNPAVFLVKNIQSPDAWAKTLNQAIIQLKSSDMQLFASAARKQAEKFSLKMMAKSYLNVYATLTN